MTQLDGPLSGLRVLASGTLADLAAATSSQPLSQAVSSMTSEGSGMQMLFLHARNHEDPRMPLLQHHLNALDHRGAVHALRVETERALSDAVVVLRALLQRAGRLLVVQDGLDPPLGGFSGNASGSYLLLAPAGSSPGDPAV